MAAELELSSFHFWLTCTQSCTTLAWHKYSVCSLPSLSLHYFEMSMIRFRSAHSTQHTDGMTYGAFCAFPSLTFVANLPLAHLRLMGILILEWCLVWKWFGCESREVWMAWWLEQKWITRDDDRFGKVFFFFIRTVGTLIRALVSGVLH